MHNGPGAERGLSWPVAAALTFLAAAAVLVLEIAAGRLLAPYVGVSLTTYTGIIGAILAGIALGAWLGGLAADAFGPRALLGPTFVLGGLAAIAAVPIVGAVGGVGLGDGFVAIVVLATVAFVAPAAILSAVAPMIVRATLTDVARSGSTVGRLSAIGTVGAITGTFLTGFVLLGLVPTRPLIVAVGGMLVVVGLALTVGLRGGGAPVSRWRSRLRPVRASRSRRPRRATRRAPTTASRLSPIATTRTGGPSSSTGSPTPMSTWPTRRSSGSGTSSGSQTRPGRISTRSNARSTSCTSAAAASRSRATSKRRARSAPDRP